jgi:hypothetical protein
MNQLSLGSVLLGKLTNITLKNWSHLKKAIIDFDSGVYAIASACDGRLWTHKGKGWESKAIANKALLSKGEDPKELVLEKHPEPWHKVEKTINRYMDNFLEKLEDQFNYEIYIKGGHNFRHDIATILGYKRGREPDPFHRKGITEYLKEQYGARLVSNVEVDDVLAIYGGREDVVLVHIDKDIEQVPGYHYNPNTDTAYEVTEIEGLRSVYKQAIIGDATDAVLGLHGVGPKSTHVKKLALMMDEDQLYSHVYTLYEQRFGTYAPMFLKENMRLVWLMRDDAKVYKWMEELLTDEEIDFYLDPWKTVEIK